jgi:large subunit ribosomal protein L16
MLSPKEQSFVDIIVGIERLVEETLLFWRFWFTALEPGWIKSRQIESGRRVLTRYVRRNGKLWIRIFPDKPITMRAAESRMGSGKGTPEWVAVVKPGKCSTKSQALTKLLLVTLYTMQAIKCL